MSDEAAPSINDAWVPELSDDESDYMLLPDFGLRHYSLPDAALVAALDMWSGGKIPEMPEGEGYWQAEASSPRVRKAIRPWQQKVFHALVRSAEAGQLKAEVLGRAFADSRLIPDRTFVEIGVLIDWLRVYGHDPCDFISEIEHAVHEEPWEVVAQVYRNRLQLRHPVPEVESAKASSFSDDSGAMEHELENLRQQVAHLQHQLKARSGGTRDDRRQLSTRQRHTLLTIIAALCEKAGIDPRSRGAAVAIASATVESGAPVSDDTIRSLLRGLPEAIDSRAR